MLPTRRQFLKGATVTAAFASLFPFRQELLSAPARPYTAARALGEYDLDEGVTYLNHAAIGTMPRAVRQAFLTYTETCERNPWLHIWGDVWVDAHQRARARAAAALGCAGEELAITHNTTMGFNILAAGLPLGKGDEVLFSSLSHTGASACWEHQAEQKGFKVRRFPFPMREAAGMTVADVVNLHLDQIHQETRVLVLPHIDNTLGLVHPIAEIAARARDRGVTWIAVDGAQSAGMVPIAPHLPHVDFFATSSHKWLQAPKGRGLLVVKQASLAKVRPAFVTWGKHRWQDDSRKLEDYGTRDMASILALEDAVAFQEKVDPAERARHYQMLRARTMARVAADSRLVWHSPRDPALGCPLMAFQLKGHPSEEIFQTLWHKHGGRHRPLFRHSGRRLSRLRTHPA